MTLKKHEFTHDIVLTVNDICHVLFNISSEEQLYKLFGIKHDQMEKVLEQLVNSLPEWLFNHPHLIEEVKNIAAREYIFFQVQERYDDPRFQEDFLTFINIFSRDILHKLESYKHQIREVRE